MSVTETLKLQEVALAAGPEAKIIINVTYADHSDLDEATELVAIRLPLQTLKYPRLVEARLEALVRVRDLLSSEIQRIEAAGRGSDPLEL